LSSLFPIEAEICSELSRIAKELFKNKANDRNWTEAFKAALYDLALKHNYKAWGTGAGNEANEWLWDISWAKLGLDNKGKYNWQDFRGIFLACEIEWKINKEEILDDFLKLTVAKAEYRLFVFSCKKKLEANNTFNFLKSHCPGSEGARYLAIAVPNDWENEKKSLLPHCGWTL